MNRNIKTIALIWVLLLVISDSNAKISQPDYILYGTATWFGGPLANETEVSIYLNNQLVTAAKYAMGSDDALNDLYALRVPMDSNDPRTFGKARPGDPASVFINGSLVADILIGDYGVAERLDIDPSNLAGGSSVLSIQAGELSEGNAGQSMLTMQIVLSQSAVNDVSVNWENTDGSAIGGDICEFDVDYINSSDVAVIAAGNLAADIEIPICGDTQIESSETFEIVISNAQNAIIQFDRATGTILDDDGLPELRVYDAVIYEPSSGSLIHDFELKLSRAYDQDVTVNYVTVAGSATESLDYLATSGTLTIPANTTTAVIPVTFLADAENESIETMTVQLSTPSNAQLIASQMQAFILDANQDEQTQEDGAIDNNSVPDLTSPSDVLFSPNSEHVYVSTLSDGGSVLRFGFEQGQLTYLETINNETVGFESGLFGLIRDLTLTANGEHMFAAASGDQAIMSFSRNSVDGVLSLNQTVENNISEDFGIDGVYGLAISPDGSHIYAVGSESDAVSVFSVNQIDGTLAFIEKEVQGVDDPDDAGTTVTFMDRPIDVVVSPDGNQVMVVGDFSSSLTVFNRDQTTGELSFQESFKSGVSGVTGLTGAASLWISPDGSHVYVLGRGDDTVSVFDRTAAGVTTFKETLMQANTDFIGLNAPTAVIGSQDGSRLYALGFDDSSMVTFERQTDDVSVEFGELTFADIEQDNVNDVESMAGPIALDINHDGKWILVAAGIDNAIQVFKTHLNDLIFADGFE